jgi:PAS domain S-box-containing protein
VRELLDLSILILAVLALSWLVFIRPVVDALVVSPVEVFWEAVPLVLDLTLIVLLVRAFLLIGGRGERGVFGMVCLALLLRSAGDLGWGYLAVQTAEAAGTPVEAAWMAAYLTLAVAASRPTSRAAAELERRKSPSRLEAVLPIALTYAVVGFIVVSWRLSGNLDWVGLGAAIALSGLLVSRQGLIAGQSEMRQFAALVNASADLAFVSQPDGALSLANPALLRSIGRPEAESPALNVRDFLSSDPAPEDLLQRAMEAGWSGEVAFRRHDATTFPVWLSVRQVWDERRGKPLLVATAHDLTRTKQREAELRSALGEVAAARTELQMLNAALEDKVEQRTRELERTVADLARLNEELKALDRLKTEFVALVSHELRAPLTNIRTGVELILDGHPGLPGAVRDPLGLVRAETERLGHFVEMILDLSALEAGRFPLHLTPLPLQAVAMDVCRRFPESARASRLRVSIAPDLASVLADERALGSILFHLLDNALKYAPDGEVRVEAAAEEERVRVSVSDCGPGIPAEERERVFEIFHRLDARDSREVYGHGLGLNLARRLVEAMGGAIRAEEPLEGGGARLVFWLPRAG